MCGSLASGALIDAIGPWPSGQKTRPTVVEWHANLVGPGPPAPWQAASIMAAAVTAVTFISGVMLACSLVRGGDQPTSCLMATRSQPPGGTRSMVLSTRPTHFERRQRRLRDRW